MFGSLNIRGGYVAHDMGTWRKDISSSSPKDVLNLKQSLAAKALHFWEKNPDPAWIAGAKEEQAFVEAYENMVKTIQDTPAEEANKYSAYMEHRLRLATSTDGGKTLGPLLHEVLSNNVSNPGMKIAAFQAAQALHPERYVKLNGMEVNYSQNENRKKPTKVAVRSLDGRSFALLTKRSSSKRKGLSGDENAGDVKIEGKNNEENLNTIAPGSSTIHAKPFQDEKSQSQSIPKQNIETRAMGAGEHSTNKSPPPKRRKITIVEPPPGRVQYNTEATENGDAKTYIPFGARISARTSGLGNAAFGTRISGLRTSRRRTFDTGTSNARNFDTRVLEHTPEIELSDFATPLTLLGKPNKRRKMMGLAKVEG